jgi:hypothetical protein
VIGGVGTLAVVVLWRRFFPQLAGRDSLYQREEKETVQHGHV